MPAAFTAPDPQTAGPDRRRAALVLVIALVVAAALVGVAAWQVGPRPAPADEGLPKSPPPLALPSDVPDDAPLARAAALLAAGDLDDARRGFVDVVAEDQNGVAGQVGLILSRWRSTGPVSVERDLAQLVREYPESAHAALHLGMVQLLLGEQRSARESLREARELGLDARDETSLRMARLADDLLHPEAFRGGLPVLVQPVEVRKERRADVSRLLKAVADGDLHTAAGQAERLQRDPEFMVRVAAIAATFDKGDPEGAVDRLDAIVADTSAPRSARDRARLMSILAELWGGGDRTDGCTRLAAVTTAATDAGTRRLATPIHSELCTSE